MTKGIGKTTLSSHSQKIYRLRKHVQRGSLVFSYDLKRFIMMKSGKIKPHYYYKRAFILFYLITIKHDKCQRY